MAHCQQLYLSVIYSFDALHFVNSLTHENFSVAFSLMHQVVKKNYGPFLLMGLKATVLLQGDSLLFTAMSPEVPATHLIDFEG